MDSDGFSSSDEDNDSVLPASEVSNTIKGDALRNLRKHIDYSLNFSQSTLSDTRNQPVEPEIVLPTTKRLLHLSEGFLPARRLLNKIGFKESRKTKGTTFGSEPPLN